MIYSTEADVEVFTKSLPWVYAHGELQTFLGHDVIMTSGLELYDTYAQLKNRRIIAAQIETFAENDRGETRKVRVFLWYGKVSKIVRGLAVCYSNESDMKFAQEQYNDKAERL